MKTKLLILLMSLSTFVFSNNNFGSTKRPLTSIEKVIIAANKLQTTVIIGALDSDLDFLHNEMKKEILDVFEGKIGEITYYKGTLNNKNVVLLKSGKGSALAAFTATVAIENFGADQIIFVGQGAGIGNELELGDIIITSSVIDFNPNIEISKNNSLSADKTLIKVAKEASNQILLNKNKTHIAPLVSGENFIFNSLAIESIKKEFEVAVTDTDGAAISKVANFYKIPFVGIKAIVYQYHNDRAKEFQEDLSEAIGEISGEVTREIFRIIKLEKKNVDTKKEIN